MLVGFVLAMATIPSSLPSSFFSHIYHHVNGPMLTESTGLRCVKLTSLLSSLLLFSLPSLISFFQANNGQILTVAYNSCYHSDKHAHFTSLAKYLRQLKKKKGLFGFTVLETFVYVVRETCYFRVRKNIMVGHVQSKLLRAAGNKKEEE